MRRRSCLGVLVVAVAWAFGPRLAAQKQSQLFISVLGPDGMPVTDLKATDHGVNEDGAECKILKIEPISWPS